MNYMYVSKGRHFYECIVICLRKSTHQDFNYWYFLLSSNFFENINQEHNLLPDFAYLWTVYLCTDVKCMLEFSAFVLTTGNILFRSINHKCQMEIACSVFSNSGSLSLVGDNSLTHKLRGMAAVKLHLNAAYAQHLALKSVYEKRQYIMGGKLFSSRIMFELACLWTS